MRGLAARLAWVLGLGDADAKVREALGGRPGDRIAQMEKGVAPPPDASLTEDEALRRVWAMPGVRPGNGRRVRGIDPEQARRPLRGKSLSDIVLEQRGPRPDE